jgi:hypothetical protein
MHQRGPAHAQSKKFGDQARFDRDQMRISHSDLSTTPGTPRRGEICPDLFRAAISITGFNLYGGASHPSSVVFGGQSLAGNHKTCVCLLSSFPEPHLFSERSSAWLDSASCLSQVGLHRAWLDGVSAKGQDAQVRLIAVAQEADSPPSGGLFVCACIDATWRHFTIYWRDITTSN